MKYILLLIFIGCKSTLTLKVDYCNGKSEIKKVNARNGICLINFKEDTSVWYLATKSNRILIDSVCDFEVLKVEK